MYARTMIKLMNNFAEFKEVTGFMLNGSVRLHSSLGEKYIDGIEAKNRFSFNK